MTDPLPAFGMGAVNIVGIPFLVDILPGLEVFGDPFRLVGFPGHR